MHPLGQAPFLKDAARDRQRAAEEAKKSTWEKEQDPFLKDTLPQLIKRFSDELVHVTSDSWEMASLRRVVIVLLEIKEPYDRLSKIGYDALFRANFKFAVTRMVDKLFQTVDGEDWFDILTSSCRSETEQTNLTRVFNQVVPDGEENEVINKANATALNFLLLLREETLK